MTTPNAPETTAIVLTFLQAKAAVDPAEFFTPRVVSDEVGKGYSTVTAALRDLRDAGHVRSEKRGAGTVWQATNPATSNPGHAVTGTIDTSETGTAVDLSGDALDLAAAGIDVTAGRADALDAHDAAWAAGELTPDDDIETRHAENTRRWNANHDDAMRPVDDMDPAHVQGVSAFVEAGVTLGGPETPAVPGTPVVDDPDAPVLEAPAGTTAWDEMERLMRDVTNPTAQTPVTVDLTGPVGGLHIATDDDAAALDTDMGDDVPAPVSAPPAGAGLDAVLGYMEAVRPVSAAPAPSADDVRPVSGAPRTSTARRGESDRRNDWGRGELAAAALAYVLAKGAPAKPSEVAKAINAFSGSTDFALKQMAKRGTLVRVPGDGPAQYAAPGSGSN